MLNVARRLLEWRDALVYAGMKGLEAVPEGISDGAKAILMDIQSVEAYFEDENSTGDRWSRLSNESDYLASDWTIEVRMKEELVDPVILDCLKKSGAACTFVTELPEIRHKVTAKKFSNLVDGYQWALTQDDAPGSIYINNDNVSLNGVLTSLGLPNVEATASEVYTQISQLFSSGMKLFIKPVDYKALVSYLSVPVHPLNDYVMTDDKERTLRYALLSHLLAQGGFGKNDKGQDWNSIIANSKQADGRKTVLALEYCLGQWEKGATLQAIEEYCARWSEWCATKASKTQDQTIAQQLQMIKGSFKVLPQFLKFSGKTCFNEKELMVNIASASTSSTYTTDEAIAGSSDMVTDVKAIAEPCDRAVWLDCYDRGLSGYQYSFLNESDIRLLNAAGMMIPLYETQLKAEAVATHIAYSYITDELVVLTPEKVECRKCYPQQIPHWDNSAEDLTAWTPTGSMTNAVEANVKQDVYHVTSSIFDGLDKTKEDGGIRRNCESFSSIEMLIKQPLDYVLQYMLGCRQTSESELPAVKGNVVHKMFNNAVLESGNDWDKVKKALVDDFDASFDKAVNEVGVALLSLENRLTYNLFRETIQTRSIPAFVNIVEGNGLSIVGSEVDFYVDFDKIGKFNAKIDMILRNSAGKYVIMDFKWTDGKDLKREDEIRKNNETQLALYAQAVRQYFGKGDDSSVEAIGYFMLRQGVFLTEYQGLKKCDEVRVVRKKKKESIFDRVKEEYDNKMKQFKGVDDVSEIELGAVVYAKNVILKGMLD
jgi:RecB family exonuclease